MKIDKLTKLAAGMGVLAGMRSMAAPAVLGEFSDHLIGTESNPVLKVIKSPIFTKVSELLAVGEMAADKSDNIPDRISPAPYIARIVLGAFAGGAAFALKSQNPLKGALIGGGAAAISTYVMFKLRTAINENTEISNMTSGLIEDSVVVGGSSLLLNSAKER